MAKKVKIEIMLADDVLPAFTDQDSLVSPDPAQEVTLTLTDIRVVGITGTLGVVSQRARDAGADTAVVCLTATTASITKVPPP